MANREPNCWKIRARAGTGWHGGNRRGQTLRRAPPNPASDRVRKRGMGRDRGEKPRPDASDPVEGGKRFEWSIGRSIADNGLRETWAHLGQPSDLLGAGAIEIDAFARLERRKPVRDLGTVASQGAGRLIGKQADLARRTTGPSLPVAETMAA